MKKYTGVIVLFMFVFLFGGCATIPKTPQIASPTSMVFEATKDKIWPLLIAEIGLNYPVAAVEKESGLLTTDFVTMPAGFNNRHMTKWVFPPGGFFATWNGLRMKMNIMIVEIEEGKTKVIIRTHYEAFESNVSKSWIVCRTNGAVEYEILTRIKYQL